MTTDNDLLKLGVFAQDAPDSMSACIYDAFVRMTNLHTDADGFDSVQVGFSRDNAGPSPYPGTADMTTWYTYDEYDVCRYKKGDSLYGYRYYSASFGRWLARDPIGLSDRELLLGLISPRDYTKQASASFNDIPKDILNKIIDPSSMIQQASTAGVNVQQYANLYGYVLNSPMQYVDTDGRAALGVGAIVTVGAIAAPF